MDLTAQHGTLFINFTDMKIEFNNITKASISELVTQSNIIQQRINDFINATIQAKDIETFETDKILLLPDLSGVELTREEIEKPAKK